MKKGVCPNITKSQNGFANQSSPILEAAHSFSQILKKGRKHIKKIVFAGNNGQLTTREAKQCKADNVGELHYLENLIEVTEMSNLKIT